MAAIDPRFRLTIVLSALIFLNFSNNVSGTTFENNDYEVYSAFLRAQLKGKPTIDELTVGPKESVIASVTSNGFPMHDDRTKELHGLTTTTIKDFASCNKTGFALEKKFALPFEYQIVSITEIQNDKSGNRFPKGYLQFSCIGFNSEKTQALFYVERLNCSCAVAEYVLMENERGVWVFKAKSVVWIA